MYVVTAVYNGTFSNDSCPREARFVGGFDGDPVSPGGWNKQKIKLQYYTWIMQKQIKVLQIYGSTIMFYKWN